MWGEHWERGLSSRIGLEEGQQGLGKGLGNSLNKARRGSDEDRDSGERDGKRLGNLGFCWTSGAMPVIWSFCSSTLVRTPVRIPRLSSGHELTSSWCAAMACGKQKLQHSRVLLAPSEVRVGLRIRAGEGLGL